MIQRFLSKVWLILSTQSIQCGNVTRNGEDVIIIITKTTTCRSRIKSRFFHHFRLEKVNFKFHFLGRIFFQNGLYNIKYSFLARSFVRVCFALSNENRRSDRAFSLQNFLQGRLRPLWRRLALYWWPRWRWKGCGGSNPGRVVLQKSMTDLFLGILTMIRLQVSLQKVGEKLWSGLILFFQFATLSGDVERI